ncbi:hypothetical protein ABFS82_14G200700 [Erythranthe guttata]
MANPFVSSCKALSKIACIPFLGNTAMGFNHKVTYSRLPFLTRYASAFKAYSTLYQRPKELVELDNQLVELGVIQKELHERQKELFNMLCNQKGITYHEEEKEKKFEVFKQNLLMEMANDGDGQNLLSGHFMEEGKELLMETTNNGGGGQMTECHSMEEWKEQYHNGVVSKKLVVVNFMKPWCEACCSIAPKLIKIAKKTTNVTILTIYTHELKFVCEEFHVEATPTFVFLKEGKEVHRIVRPMIKDLQREIDKHGAVTA